MVWQTNFFIKNAQGKKMAVWQTIFFKECLRKKIGRPNCQYLLKWRVRPRISSARLLMQRIIPRYCFICYYIFLLLFIPARHTHAHTRTCNIYSPNKQVQYGTSEGSATVRGTVCPFSFRFPMGLRKITVMGIHMRMGTVMHTRTIDTVEEEEAARRSFAHTTSVSWQIAAVRGTVCPSTSLRKQRRLRRWCLSWGPLQKRQQFVAPCVHPHVSVQMKEERHGERGERESARERETETGKFRLERTCRASERGGWGGGERGGRRRNLWFCWALVSTDDQSGVWGLSDGWTSWVGVWVENVWR